MILLIRSHSFAISFFFLVSNLIESKKSIPYFCFIDIDDFLCISTTYHFLAKTDILISWPNTNSSLNC